METEYKNKLNGICSHGNHAIDCIHCKEDKYFAEKHPVKIKKIRAKNAFAKNTPDDTDNN